MMTDEKKLGRWATKRRERRERGQKTKVKKEVKKEKEKEVEPESYRRTARLRLQTMFKKGFGTKRSSDKMNDDTRDKIYSKNTFETYKRQSRYFAEWIEKSYPEAKTIEQARDYVDEYLLHLIEIGKSPCSIATAKAALVKVFQTDASAFVETPARTRASITRSRLDVAQDSHVSEKTEARLSRFTSATGLRRAEMLKIEADDLFFKSGKAYLSVTKGTKGGKSRIVEIVGLSDGDTKDIVEWIQGQKGRLFPHITKHYDNHHYRAIYARRVYDKYARKEKDIPPNERYVMRKDRAGEVFDKLAMAVTSKNLGHNRIDVIAQSYLYN
jgi:integrase